MKTFVNPVNPRGDDPFVTRDGKDYLYCYSIGRGVAVTRAAKLHEIKKEKEAAVYKAPEEGPWSEEYWAPELHKIGNRWYIYVAADDGNNDHHRMYCLGATTDDPAGSYELLGKISDASDKWAIDGTVLQLDGECYFIWSGWEGEVNETQKLYIAHMSSPTEIDSERVCLSSPEFEWEKRGSNNGLPTINEGPAILQRNGGTYLIYSASGSWCDDYCLGMLTLTDRDPMNPASWVKSELPVFSKAEGAYGPGHCSFTTSPDGSEDYMVYHANEISGSGWGGRSLRMQKVNWQDGNPVFGMPVPIGQPMTLPSDGYSLPHGRLQPAMLVQSAAAAGISLLALVLVGIGGIWHRQNAVWFLPLIGIALIVELIWLWQRNLDWLGKFLLTNDGICYESPLSSSWLLKWDAITDACYIAGNPAKKNSGTFCFSAVKLTLAEKKKLITDPVGERLVKLRDREGLWEALAERLPENIRKQLEADLTLAKP